MTNTGIKTNKAILLTGIKSTLSNFNADFGMNPREHPSPYSLKYVIRDYWNKKDKDVFLLQTTKEKKNDKNEIKVVVESFSDKFDAVVDKSVIEKDITLGKIYLNKFIDTKTFGFVNVASKYTHGETGIAQVSFAKNLYKDTKILDYDVNSQVASGEGKKQSTIGSRSVVDFAIYNFTTIISPDAKSTLFKDYMNRETTNSDFKEKCEYTNEDYEELLEAMKYGVSNFNTNSKIGSCNTYLVQIELKEGALVNMIDYSSLIKVTKVENENPVINFSKLTNWLKDMSDKIESVTLFADKYTNTLEGWDELNFPIQAL